MRLSKHSFNLQDGGTVYTMAPLEAFRQKCAANERIANLKSQNAGLKHTIADIAEELKYIVRSGYLDLDLSANGRISAFLDVVELQLQN